MLDIGFPYPKFRAIGVIADDTTGCDGNNKKRRRSEFIDVMYNNCCGGTAADARTFRDYVLVSSETILAAPGLKKLAFSTFFVRFGPNYRYSCS